MISTGARVADRVLYHADSRNVADIHALKPDRRTNAYAAGVVHVGADHDLFGEEPGGPSHQENKNGQRDAGEDDGERYPKL